MLLETGQHFGRVELSTCSHLHVWRWLLGTGSSSQRRRHVFQLPLE